MLLRHSMRGLKGAVAGAKFSELFFASCKDEELAAYVKTLL